MNTVPLRFSNMYLVVIILVGLPKASPQCLCVCQGKRQRNARSNDYVQGHASYGLFAIAPKTTNVYPSKIT